MRSTIPSTVSQALFDTMLSTPNRGVANRVKLKLLDGLRRLFVRRGDPLVLYNLDGTKIMLPLSHNLPFYRKVFPQYSANIARVAQHVQAAYPDLTLIDIGANVGDTVAILRRLSHFPILCVEAEARFSSILRQNLRLFEDVYFEHAFLDSVGGRVRGRVVSESGTARLVTDAPSGNAVETKTLADVLRAHPLFAEPKMIKVDTDGMDCRILRSARDLLSRHKPVIFFEYDPHYFQEHDNGFEVFESLLEAGYKSMMVYENNGDYLITVELSDKSLVEDIHKFYSGRAGQHYCDICAFHGEDLELCQTVRSAEIDFFDTLRSTS